MKRGLLFFILGFFLPICALAQIQRMFFDFQLGSTPKKVVINHLKNKGENVKKKNDDFYYLDSIRFGGHVWPFAAFMFYEDKLKSVYFSDDEEKTSRESLDILWNSYRHSLDNKYSEFIDNDFTSDGIRVYYDNMTQLVLMYTYQNGYKGISLSYTDQQLQNKEISKDKNEL